jgi:F0F1-type ATP synthase membrane subunit b/b'
MAEGRSRAPQPSLTPLPRVEDLPIEGGGYDRQSVQEAFDAFRRHTAQLQAQLRVLQAAGRTAQVEPTGHAVRMDALHLIRAAAEFADTLERDAQSASAAQIAKTEEEVRRRQRDLQAQEGDLERYRQETERRRTEIVSAAKKEARDIVSRANAEAATELREAEAKGTRLLEQARHQATELTNSVRAEVEQTLEWARAQASAILARAQHGAEQLLGSAGLGEAAAAEVAESIVRAATAAAGPLPGTEPVAPTPKGPKGRRGARRVPGTAEEEDASTPEDGSGHQADS